MLVNLHGALDPPALADGSVSILDPARDNLEFVVDARGGGKGATVRCGHGLFLGSSLTLRTVVNRDGSERGYMIGWPFPGDRERANGNVTGPDTGQAYGDWASEFSGSFICFLKDEAGRPGAFHLDAIGSLGLVYDPVRRMLASIPDLLPSLRNRPDHGAETRRRISVLGAASHYGFGETSVPGIHRLMPNFALGEADFTPRRFWPLEPGRPACDRRDPEATTRAIFDRVRRNVDRVLDGGQAALHLTAGTDTRMILAAAWERRAEAPFFTFATTRTAGSLDMAVSPVLARRFGLRHFALVADPPDRAGEEDAMRRTGYCVSDGGLAVAPISALVQDRWHCVGGIAGEIGRAFFWDSAAPAPRPTAAELVSRTGVIVGADTLAAAEAWLATIPEAPAHAIWDLAYVEQRLGHWAGAMVYGFRGTRPTMSGFNSFDVVRGMFGLPAEYRLSGAFAAAFIGCGATELLREPINRHYGARQFLDARQMLKTALPAGAFRRLKAAVNPVRGAFRREGPRFGRR